MKEERTPFEEHKARENAKRYAQWLSCGFSGDMEVNEYGWFEKGNHFEGTEKVTVFEKGYHYRAYVEYYQLPNGKWVAGSDLNCPLHGYGSSASIWSKQYNTKEEAVTAELAKIEGALEQNDRKPFVMKGIEKCRSEFKKPVAFDIDPNFYYGTNFQQTSLFYQESSLF